MREEEKKMELPPTSAKFDPSFMEKIKNMLNRKRNNDKLSTDVIKKREKERKNKRKISNKSRNINQKKNKLNKFQK